MTPHGRITIGGALVVLVAGCAGPESRWTYDHGAPIRGDASQRKLALIFTGGEHGQATGTILDMLAARGVHASFFLTGGYLAVPEQRAAVARMLADGHYVGPHSHAHLLYCPWEDRGRTLVTRADFVADLERNLAELRALHCFDDGRPVYFVPPYEWFNEDQVAWAAALGVRLINFTPGTGSNRDWIPEQERGFVSSEQIIADVLAFERREPAGLNGFVLLLHVGSTRADLLDTEVATLVDGLRRRGYGFVRVDELLK